MIIPSASSIFQDTVSFNIHHQWSASDINSAFPLKWRIMSSRLLQRKVGVTQEWDGDSQKEKNLKYCLVWFIKFNVNNPNGFLILPLVMVCGVVWHGFVQTPYTQTPPLQPLSQPSLNPLLVIELINVKNIRAITAVPPFIRVLGKRSSAGRWWGVCRVIWTLLKPLGFCFVTDKEMKMKYIEPHNCQADLHSF